MCLSEMDRQKSQLQRDMVVNENVSEGSIKKNE